ncbi:hypothetical protein AB0368_22875 [Actinoplanes sp. NPDC051475]|uniref:hypothetical protein n=1 Tax=Actinoplanes sp. NPDC051475 TaxID=3157225 RepID=UPI00344D9C29
MTLWRTTRNEVAGAWRSLRYDLGRREGEPGAAQAGTAPAVPDVTATGFSTFGGAGITDGLRTAYGVDQARHPRRLVAVTAFGVLAVAGATGSYFAVVNGLGALLSDPGGAEPYPLAAAAPGGAHGDLSHEGLGQGSAPDTVTAPQPTGGTIRVLPNPVATTARPPVTRIAPLLPHRSTVGGADPATGPTDCDCLTPPVPTPTAAPSTPNDPSPTPSPSASTDDSAEPEPSDDPTSPASEGSSGGGSGDTGGRTERARHTGGR